MNKYSSLLSSMDWKLLEPCGVIKWECKPLRKIKVIIFNHQADSPFYVWPDLAICKFRKVWSYIALLQASVCPNTIWFFVSWHLGNLGKRPNTAVISQLGHTWHRMPLLRPGVIKQPILMACIGTNVNYLTNSFTLCATGDLPGFVGVISRACTVLQNQTQRNHSHQIWHFILW